jgi:hypothetical protein
MADITYTRSFFAHNDWVDGESIVQASGENGFNTRFHNCEKEFDTISTTFGQVNSALKNIPQLGFLSSQPSLSLGPSATSSEFDVETYDRTTLPANVDKPYFCVITPITGIIVVHTFLYRPVPGNKMRVTVAFYNPTAAPVNFAFRIVSLAGQSE